jgi:hypothetical protein
MSVSSEKLWHDLKNYFLGSDRFANAANYTGMLASQRPRIFIAYFETLNNKERSELTSLLTRVAIGDDPELVAYLPSAVHTLLSLCLAGYLKEFDQSAAVLERVFTDPSNVELWIHAEDMTEPKGGAEFKQTWNYAAALSFILKALQSNPAAETRRYLLQRAESQTFKDTLNSQ